MLEKETEDDKETERQRVVMRRTQSEVSPLLDEAETPFAMSILARHTDLKHVWIPVRAAWTSASIRAIY